MLGRKAKKVAKSTAPSPPFPGTSGIKEKKKKAKPTPRLARPPRSAAIIVTALEEGYAAAMRLARQEINLEDFGIKELRAKRAMTGTLKIEISDAEGRAKAPQLANKMAEILGPQRVSGSSVSRSGQICAFGGWTTRPPQQRCPWRSPRPGSARRQTSRWEKSGGPHPVLGDSMGSVLVDRDP